MCEDGVITISTEARTMIKTMNWYELTGCPGGYPDHVMQCLLRLLRLNVVIRILLRPRCTETTLHAWLAVRMTPRLTSIA